MSFARFLRLFFSFFRCYCCFLFTFNRSKGRIFNSINHNNNNNQTAAALLTNQSNHFSILMNRFGRMYPIKLHYGHGVCNFSSIFLLLLLPFALHSSWCNIAAKWETLLILYTEIQHQCNCLLRMFSWMYYYDYVMLFCVCFYLKKMLVTSCSVRLLLLL